MPSTIADGIAVKRPGELTLELVRRWVEEVVTVDDDAIAEAMVFLVEYGKLVTEGAGAVGVAALLNGALRPAESGTTAVVLSGGNVDAHVLAEVINRHQTGIGRRARLFSKISDRPGGLVDFLQIIARAGGNVLDVTHVRDGVPLHVRETGVEVLVESRSERHGDELLEAARRCRLRGRGARPALSRARRPIPGGSRGRRCRRRRPAVCGCPCRRPRSAGGSRSGAGPAAASGRGARSPRSPSRSR